MYDDTIAMLKINLLQAELTERSKMVEILLNQGQPELIPQAMDRTNTMFDNIRSEYRLRGINI